MLSITRTIVGLLVGALFGLAALALQYSRSPAIALEMDRGVSGVVTGLYGSERVDRETFAWTGRDATMTLRGLDRTSAWSCSVRVRGGRAEASMLPELVISVDGVITGTHAVTNDYQDVAITLPPRASGSGATVTLTSTKTFTPGPSDRRTLGVVVDRWICAPASAGFLQPPPRVMLAAAIGGAALGAAFGLIATGVLATMGGAALLALAQAVPLGWEFGMFTAYPERATALALWIAALLVAAVRGTEWALGRRLSGAARLVAAFTAAVLYLKLLALLHPSKPLVDVVFHAHRLQWVLDGRFYFTQPMPSGVRFPYAIGLYVFAAPWSLVTSDFVLLLRIVVSVAEALGALVVYVLISRIWTDRLAAVVGAILCHVVPRTFEIVGNANMTNAFAQSLALVVLAAAVLWPLQPKQRLQVVGLTVLTACALLSHISTFTTLPAILLGVAALYWWRGGGDLRRPALAIAGALVVAAVLAVVVYYAHFGDAYRSAARVRASPAATVTGSVDAATVPLPSKVIDAGRLTVAAVGWPIFLLALAGMVPLWRRGLRDRLSLATGALMLTYAVFVASVVLTPVERTFQRYAAEFISRVTLATYPAMVLLAGLGAAAAWRTGWATRILAAALLGGAGWVGVASWIEWLR
jgi:hypothetical protein